MTEAPSALSGASNIFTPDGRVNRIVSRVDRLKGRCLEAVLEIRHIIDGRSLLTVVDGDIDWQTRGRAPGGGSMHRATLTVGLWQYALAVFDFADKDSMAIVTAQNTWTDTVWVARMRSPTDKIRLSCTDATGLRAALAPIAEALS